MKTAAVVLALLSALIGHSASAQVACSQLTQNALLAEFPDNAPTGSIIPRYVRNFICSTTLTLPNIAALRSNTNTQSSLYILGNSTAADGGQGVFTFNPTDTTSPDNGITIIVDAVGHRWYRSSSSAWLVPEAANTVLAGPTSGSAAFATFRSLVDADLPSNVLIGPILSPAHGGTGVNNGTWTITLGGNFTTQLGDTYLYADPAHNNDFIDLGGTPAPNYSSGGGSDCTGIFGTGNFGAGAGVLLNLTGGCNNTGAGLHALSANTSGSLVTAYGAKALMSNISGVEQTGVGYAALSAATTSTFNTGIGSTALQDTTTGSFNTSVGAHSMLGNITGSDNAVLGYNVAVNEVALQNSTLVGFNVMHQAVNTTDNTVFGYQAMFGTDATDTASLNTAIGEISQFHNGTSSKNTSVGYGTLAGLVSGIGENTAVGFEALSQSATTASNTAVGYAALFGATTSDTASHNVAVGDLALNVLATGDGNTVVGSLAGEVMTSGAGNLLAGRETGLSLTTGSHNVLLGASTSAASQGQVTTGSQNISIGYRSVVQSPTASGQLDIGNFFYCTGLTGLDTGISNGLCGVGTQTPAYPWDVAGTVRATNVILIPIVTSALPTCNTAAKGMTAVVTDATTPTYRGTLTGGSTAVTHVLCTGSAWITD